MFRAFALVNEQKVLKKTNYVSIILGKNFENRLFILLSFILIFILLVLVIFYYYYINIIIIVGVLSVFVVFNLL